MHASVGDHEFLVILAGKTRARPPEIYNVQTIQLTKLVVAGTEKEFVNMSLRTEPSHKLFYLTKFNSNRCSLRPF